MAKRKTYNEKTAAKQVENWREDVMAVAAWLQNEPNNVAAALVKDPGFGEEMNQLTGDLFSLMEAIREA